MLYSFVISMLGGVPSPALAFIPYMIGGVLLVVFVAVVLNFFFGTFSQFLFKS